MKMTKEMLRRASDGATRDQQEVIKKTNMTKQELKVELIKIRNGGLITPLLEELWRLLKKG